MKQLKKELEKLLADNINPIGQLNSPKEISDAVIELIRSKVPEFDKKIKFVPPTIDQAKEYLINNGGELKISIAETNDIAEQFLNYYQAINWKVGKRKIQMVNWRTALSGWVKRGYHKQKNKESKVSETMGAYLGLGSLKKTKKN